ncbi:MAG: alanine--tRNA ligase [Candidatus Melainabacteria bacterium]|nr:alanine--tRNA ligase [Candidatus Melainabacteria bacterium]
MTLSGAQIRDKFISYFRDKRGHLHKPSSSLIPDNPTLLLTSAGMVQFVPIFLGNAPATTPPRVVTVQKCARAGGKDSDIENIGRTSRHHSFFEMLGNFSFGDYFKKEVIPWAWEYVTKDLGLDPEKLTVTIFRGDDEVPADEEAFDIWHKTVGVPKERIIRMSRKDNFWGPPGPTGPCGPCSEIYFDRGPEYGCSDDAEKCGIGICECDRYMEFWNLVFMELFKDEHGKFTPLAAKNVDTGSGLERVALILQKKNNTFETDLFFPILEEVSKIAGVKYTGGIVNTLPTTPTEKTDSYLKIIADHARAISFLITDGVRTSNIGRGYVLRFITRRAARFGRLLGIDKPFLHNLVPIIVSIYGDAYPELKKNEEFVSQAIKEEEERFAKTIDRGIKFLDELLREPGDTVDGAKAFNLYSTYGFPYELTKEIAEEHNKTIDLKGYELAKETHSGVSAGDQFNVIITGEEATGKILKEHGATKFTGYKDLSGEGTVLGILKSGSVVESAEEGDEVDLILNATPFYAESGGQLGDIGFWENADCKVLVLDTKKQEGLHVHRIRVVAGTLVSGAKLNATVDTERRNITVLHHSTAHLFHSAVRELLGKHVVQAGSQVGPQAMRFDFNFERQVSKEEIAEIERMMNTWVQENAEVKVTEMGIEEAKKTGAIAMFGEKYGDIVRVVEMGDFSIEFCGGTHVSSTGSIGLVKIVSEGSISSGVRRIEALSGPRAWNYISEQMNYLGQASEKLKAKPSDLVAQIDRLQAEIKSKEKMNEQLQERLALANVSDLMAKVETLGSVRFVCSKLDNVSSDGLKTIAASIRDKGEDLVVLLGSVQAPDRVSLVCAVSQPLTKKGFHAGNIINEVAQICGGKGGGRPDIAQAGGKDADKIEEALRVGRTRVSESASAGAAH